MKQPENATAGGASFPASHVRLSGKKLVEYRKQLLAEMEKATGAMQDYADRLGNPNYPTAEADLKESAMRYQRAGIAHMRTIAKSEVYIDAPNTQTEGPAESGPSNPINTHE